MNRRLFLTACAAAPLLRGAEGWVELFNGRDLEGWRASENKASWSVVDGKAAANGPRSHLFYTGAVNNAVFRNFDLEVEALAHPGCNSGVYFHTAYQERDFPYKGFEIQINNSQKREGNYQERKRTGSLYGIRNVYKQFIADDQWFRLAVAVRGKNVRIRLDGMLVVDYTEPDPPVIPDGPETGRFLSQGMFALQCHNQGSLALFRAVRVRVLPDETPTPSDAIVPVADDTFRDVIRIGRHNLPMVDWNVRLGGGLGIDEALRKSRRDGIEYGVVFSAMDTAGARAFAARMKGQPVFTGLLAVRGEIAPEVAGLFDYTIDRADRMGQRPMNICMIAKDDDMGVVIAAAAKNNVAIEIDEQTRLPAARDIVAAKAAGCRFAFGSGNSGVGDLGRLEYGLKMVDECKLDWQDFFIPALRWRVPLGITYKSPDQTGKPTR